MLFTVRYRRSRSPEAAPVGRDVRLLLTSSDVIHGFFVPQYRIKQDAMPGMTTQAWFQAPAPDFADVFCAEYCGERSAAMMTKVATVPEDLCARWEAGEPVEIAGITPRASPAEHLLRTKGWLDRHSIDGSTKGVERTVTADEAYCRTALYDPGAAVLVACSDEMPSGRGKISEEEFRQIVEFLEQLAADE